MSKDDARNSLTEDLGASPSRIDNAELRFEAQRAFVWALVIGLVLLAIYISQSLLVIFGAMVLAAMIDGGARVLGRFLPIGRTWRLGIIIAAASGFLYWLTVYAGSQISREAAQLPSIIEQQATLAFAWLDAQGFGVDPENIQDIASNLISGMGTVTKALGGILGGLTTLLLITIIGVYLAFEPQLYERGVAWMLPRHRRSDFYETVSRMAYTMRRLMAGRLIGMVFEGLFTWVLLAWYGVPMAALLAILTGLLAFIPNLGALIAGSLMVLVGFSGGTEMGLYTIFVYFLVQTFDGYVVIPMIARKTVDLAPALVLAAQLIMGILFGILGLFLADPALAMLKVFLERRAERLEANQHSENGNAQNGA